MEASWASVHDIFLLVISDTVVHEIGIPGSFRTADADSVDILHERFGFCDHYGLFFAVSQIERFKEFRIARVGFRGTAISFPTGIAGVGTVSGGIVIPPWRICRSGNADGQGLHIAESR
jgi:hypothetical protein